ncbi:hypothetical protein ES705_17830 [subsurface metagenome]
MTINFQKVKFNFNLLLSKEAIDRVFGKTETELLLQLLTNLMNAITDTSPNYFRNHLVNIILSAIAFGWKSSKNLEDYKNMILEIQKELEKEKYSNYIQ